MKSLIVTCYLFSLTALAQKAPEKADVPAKPAVKFVKVVHFTPGKYVLEDGDEECDDDGPMGPREDGETFAVGDRHGFELATQSLEMPGDAPGDEDCVYNVQESVETKPEMTVMSFTEARLCKGELKHTLTETGRVSKDRIELEVVQSGENPTEYSCVWERQAEKKKPTAKKKK
jgi:hypothetical protein